MFSENDIKIIKKNIDKIASEAERITLEYHKEPKQDEFSKTQQVILDFIKRKRRIIYGGYAQDLLIKNKNKNDGIYDEYCRPDIEFYTPDPIRDTMEICELLYSKDLKYIEGKMGAHLDTYKVFANTINYCDITYMPMNVYNSCPTITVNGLRLTHPHFIMVDIYRAFTDIMSAWRYEKTFKRAVKLLNYYQFDDKAQYNVLSYHVDKKTEDIKTFIRKNIIHTTNKMNLIVVGHYAYNYLVKKENEKNEIKFSYYQVISIDLDNDIKTIEQKLKKEYGNKLEMKKFYPFFQFFDYHYEFEVDGKVVLKVYGNNKRCIVNNYSEKKNTLFGSPQLIIMYLLIDYNYAIIKRNDKERNNYLYLLVNYFKIRDRYLKKNNKNVLDNTPFQEFTFNCKGIAEDVLRESFVNRNNKKSPRFNYKPTGRLGKVPHIRFANTSGNEVIKKEHLVPPTSIEKIEQVKINNPDKKETGESSEDMYED